MNNNINLIKELNNVLDKANPGYINGCVCLHFDKQTKELKSISPMVPATSIEELFNQLQSAEKAIHHFLQELVNKGLHKGGQLS